MVERATPPRAGEPRAEDLFSVGSRISWGAILAGAFVALAIYFLLGVLGGAVGVSVSDRVTVSKLETGAIIWTIVAVSGALFAGGLVTTQFTVGENKVEAVLYGIIMWGFLVGMLLALGAAGMRGGFNAMVRLTETPATVESWDAAARNAGIPADQVEELRRRNQGTLEKKSGQTEAEQQATTDALKRLSWFIFGGTWISMLAAALGAWVGAGPTFRLVTVDPLGRPTVP
jgi:hypothetical protein